MGTDITKAEMKTLLKSQQGELDGVLMYKALADAVAEERDAEAFRQLAAEEGHHTAVFHGLTHRTLKAKKTMAILLSVLYRVIGKKRLYPLIAQGEYAALETYKPIAERFPEVESVRQDEKRHGDIVMALLEEADDSEEKTEKRRSRYMLAGAAVFAGVLAAVMVKRGRKGRS